MSELEGAFRARHDVVLTPLARRLETFLADVCSDITRIDRISARAKSVERFLTKATANRGDAPKYDEPMEQIQDQVGARIVVLFRQDVDAVSRRMEEFLRYVESREVEPAADYEFSYFGRHYISLLPDDVLDPTWPRDLVPGFFELQIKTVFQHAWSEASHDIAYKPMLGELTPHDKRALAFASAQAWGADNAFQEILANLSQGKPLSGVSGSVVS